MKPILTRIELYLMFCNNTCSALSKSFYFEKDLTFAAFKICSLKRAG